MGYYSLGGSGYNGIYAHHSPNFAEPEIDNGSGMYISGLEMKLQMHDDNKTKKTGRPRPKPRPN